MNLPTINGNPIQVSNRKDCNKSLEELNLSSDDILEFNNKEFQVYDPVSFVEAYVQDRYDWEGLNKTYRKGINVGAEIGHSTIMMSAFCNETISIEPFPEYFSQLLIACDILGPNHKCINAMVSNLQQSEGSIRYQMDEADIDMSCIARNIHGDSLGSADFIKMDCEGMEYTVLRSFQTTLKNDKPDLYVCRYDTSFPQYVGYLEHIGYRIIRIDRQYFLFMPV